MWPNAQADGAEDSRMVHAGRPPSSGVKYGVNCFFNVATKRLVRPAELNMAAEECYIVNIAKLEEGKKNSVEDRSCPRRRTFTLDTEPNVRVVPQFLTRDEAEYFTSLAEDRGQENGSFAGAAVLLQTMTEPVAPVVQQIEERLIAWNEFAPENMGYLRLVRANTELGMGNRGCGQRCATICLTEKADVHFPHIGLRVAMTRGDLLEWPNAWFQESSHTHPEDKVTVEDLRATHVHLFPGLMLDASFHDKPVRSPQVTGEPK
ncbi:Ank2 [Symbiodinium pilosum]|uniref:Ank2 protein n=1 Tax=Symbiodinium pilosum TaxID=2952 RepID=A0A812QQE9_SYMPI|nr:Ank2 [Symbiodinium pilosum]